jgi:hypothetical protein
VTVDDALKAVTINAAYHLRREHDLGSIAVGKLADFVELSADPYTVDVGTHPARRCSERGCRVTG